MVADPLIVYIPGLKPKPEEAAHRKQLLRCLRAGIEKIDARVATEISAGDAFHLVCWTYDFYGEHRDINLDIDDIERVLRKNGPSEKDVATVMSLKRRLTRWLFRTADFLPFLIPHFATEELEIHLRDFNKYLRNKKGVAEDARQKVKQVLDDANAAERPVLVLGHSMGSVIAYESLWQLSRVQKSDIKVDFLTSGSPLGQSIVQRHLMGAHAENAERYPGNIRQWTNIAAVGEFTAIDMQLKIDFSGMIEQGLLADITDLESYNYYHMHGSLNVHAEYGYLINEVTAQVICDWWCSCTVE